jgi:hypothetical protein
MLMLPKDAQSYTTTTDKNEVERRVSVKIKTRTRQLLRKVLKEKKARFTEHPGAICS